MLKKEIKKLNLLFILVVFIGCVNTQKENSLNEIMLTKSKSLIGTNQYLKIYNCVRDSFNLWVLNKLGAVEAEFTYSYYNDSLLCFNSSKDRFISCDYVIANVPAATADNINFVYGEKINNFWYFFKGATIVIPREMVKEHNVKIPLNYQQLHQIALKEIYSPYLTRKGEINNDWFTSEFENVGWGNIKKQEYLDWCFKGKRYTNEKEFYQACHLCKVQTNWYQRDTNNPIKQLLPKADNLP
ncbi:MAG: hypothetical protein ABIP51_21800 [Bacteroidia bacterium]